LWNAQLGFKDFYLKYDLKVQYVPGIYQVVSDALSRAPVENGDSDLGISLSKDLECSLDYVFSTMPVSDERLDQIRNATKKDIEMQKLCQAIENGWPNERFNCDKDIIAYWNISEELTVLNGIIFKGSKIVVPVNLRHEILH
jgi:hypothetical protein